MIPTCHFNPRPPWGGRHCAGNNSGVQDCDFNPRPPWGGRQCDKNPTTNMGNFNPRPPWGGRLWVSLPLLYTRFISIHALRGEGDAKPVMLLFCPGCISIHALRGEGDFRARKQPQKIMIFQSTPSVGRATTIEDGKYYTLLISIHALRGEGDYRCLNRP